MRVPSVGRVAVAASPNAVGGPRATLQLHQVTLGLRRTLGSRGEEALAHNGVCTVRLAAGADVATWVKTRTAIGVENAGDEARTGKRQAASRRPGVII